MFKKYLSVALLSLMLCGVNLQKISAQIITDNPVERKRIESNKTEIYSVGLGEKAKVVVKLKNGAKLTGYISQSIEDSFDLSDAKTKQFTTIPYSDVTEVKKNRGWSNGSKLALGVGVMSVVIILSVINRKNNSGGFCPLGCNSF